MTKSVKKEKGSFRKDALLLLTTIREEIRALESFLLFLENEKTILLKSEVQSFREIEKERSKKLCLAKKLEQKRKNLIASISKKMKLGSNKKDTEGILNLLSYFKEVNLSQLQSTLWELSRKVDLQRKKNDDLIKRSFGLIDNNIEKKQTSLVSET